MVTHRGRGREKGEGGSRGYCESNGGVDNGVVLYASDAAQCSLSSCGLKETIYYGNTSMQYSWHPAYMPV